MKKACFLPALAIGLSFIAFGLTSCTKTVHDTVQTAPSIESLLTGTDWEMDSTYNNYTGPGTGTLAYVRGGSGNTMNMDGYYYTWTKNGFIWRVQNGTYYQWRWNFKDGDSSLLVTQTPWGTNYSRILTISSTRFTEYDSTGGFYDVMIPRP
ncbi:MAG TPA: hypothetical protein VGR89_08250 [Puia sp.]|nr:hypothetical protein [Puia sp.]